MVTKKKAKTSTAKKGSRKPKPTFLSSLSISKIIESAGTAAETRAALEADLKSKGVDTTDAMANLPRGADRDLEAVARLVSLARGHGYVVQLRGKARGVSFQLTSPSDSGMLQSRHDRDRGK